MPRFSMNNATVKFKDGTPFETEIKIAEGQLQWTESRNVEYQNSKGTLESTREGDEVPCQLSMNFIWEFLINSSGGSPVYPYEALHFIGEAASWVSSDTADPCATPPSIDVEVTFDLSCSSEDTEVYLFNFFRWETISPDGGNGQVAVAGNCKIVKPTVTRV